MMEYLGYSIESLREINGYHTASEITRQPAIWKDIYEDIMEQKNKLLNFFREIEGLADYNIILTGAGSSAFIGEVLESAFIKNVSRHSRAVATTTIVTHPEVYFTKDRPTLVISFARSGNSPESVATIALANEMCDEISHFVITCNPSGRIIEEMDSTRDYLFLLPDEANDIGLAMTGSFTGMLLAGYLVTKLTELEALRDEIDKTINYGKCIIEDGLKKIKEIADHDFSRVVFLGSGPLLGIARESHLKVQELTNGTVMCNYDSYLGLRHGPKVVIDSETVVVFLLSNDHYVQLYESDLINDLVNESLGLVKLGVSDLPEPELDIDVQLSRSSGSSPLDTYLFSLVSVLPAQILGFLTSVRLGCSPDSPSKNGTISRVVQGVRLYKYPNRVDIKKEYKIT